MTRKQDFRIFTVEVQQLTSKHSLQQCTPKTVNCIGSNKNQGTVPGSKALVAFWTKKNVLVNYHIFRVTWYFVLGPRALQRLTSEEVLAPRRNIRPLTLWFVHCRSTCTQLCQLYKTLSIISDDSLITNSWTRPCKRRTWKILFTK